MEKKVIRYEFCDGTVCEFEVADGLYAVYEQLVKEEKRSHWRNTRRHVSLDCLNNAGIDIEAADGDPLDGMLADEARRGFEGKLSCLKPPQRELLDMFLDGKKVTQIAKELGCSHPTISKRLKVISGKLKLFF